MRKIDRLLTLAKQKAQIFTENKKWEELIEVIERLTTDQLIEIVYNDVSEERFREIFESVGGLEG